MNNMTEYIKESEQDINLYDEVDFIEATLKFFKNWLVNKIGDDVNNYPFSYLSKKYGKEFMVDTFGENNNVFYHGNYSDWSHYGMSKVGKELVRQGKVKLPSLRSEQKFTEKYKKAINIFLKRYNFPSWTKLEFEEKNPYDVTGYLYVDFPKMLMSVENPVYSHTLERQLSQYFQDFLGVDTTSPVYGGLHFRIIQKSVNEEEWIKKVLNKEIKKHIKTFDTKKILHSIRFEPKTNGATMRIIFKEDARWNDRNDLYDKIRKYVQDELGYSKISVDRH